MGLFDNLFKNKPSPADEEVVEAAKRITETEKARLLEAEKVAKTADPKPPGSGNRAAHAPVARAYSPRSLGQAVPPRSLSPGKGHLKAARFSGGGDGGRPQEIRLVLDDVLPRIPADLLNDAPRDGKREIRFRVEDVTADIARGRAAVALVRIAEQVPEIFRFPISPTDETQVRLPLQKLVEQIGFLPVKQIPESKAARTPPLPALTANAQGVTSISPAAPTVFKPESDAALGNPEAGASKSIELPPPVELTAEAEPLVAEDPHKLQPPGSSSAKAPLPSEGDESDEKPARRMSPEPSLPAPDFQSAGVAGDAKITLSLAAVLRDCPKELICAPLPPITDQDRISVAFAPIEKQLPTGQVDISSVRFVFALPPHLQQCFEAREGIRIPLPIEEVLRNLPDVAVGTGAARATEQLTRQPEPAPAPFVTPAPELARDQESVGDTDVSPAESAAAIEKGTVSEEPGGLTPSEVDTPFFGETVPVESTSLDPAREVVTNVDGEEKGAVDAAAADLEVKSPDETAQITEPTLEPSSPVQESITAEANVSLQPGQSLDLLARESLSDPPLNEPVHQPTVLSPENPAAAEFSVETLKSAGSIPFDEGQSTQSAGNEPPLSLTPPAFPIPAPLIGSILPPPLLGGGGLADDSLAARADKQSAPVSEPPVPNVSFPHGFVPPPIHLAPPPNPLVFATTPPILRAATPEIGSRPAPPQNEVSEPAPPSLPRRPAASSPFIPPLAHSRPAPAVAPGKPGPAKESVHVEPPPSPILPVRLVSPPAVRPVVAPPPLFGAGLGEDDLVPEAPLVTAEELVAKEPAPPPPSPLDLAKARSALALRDDAGLEAIGDALTRLPGLHGCLLSVRHESANCGDIPESFDPAAARALASRVAVALSCRGMAAIQHATIFTAEGCLSVFARGNAVVCALHRTRAFLPGVCDQLAKAADALADA